MDMHIKTYLIENHDWYEALEQFSECHTPFDQAANGDIICPVVFPTYDDKEVDFGIHNEAVCNLADTYQMKTLRELLRECAVSRTQIADFADAVDPVHQAFFDPLLNTEYPRREKLPAFTLFSALLAPFGVVSICDIASDRDDVMELCGNIIDQSVVDTIVHVYLPSHGSAHANLQQISTESSIVNFAKAALSEFTEFPELQSLPLKLLRA